MGSVKTPKGVGTVASRIRAIRRALNPHGGKEMDWPAFATFAGVPLGTAKKWESRSQISADSAEQLAERLMGADLPCAPAWIRKGAPPAPAWLVETRLIPASEVAGQGVRSGAVRSVEEQQALWRGFRVLAGRIARTIQQTIAGNELGYSQTSRAWLADSLEVFARDLEARCGEKVCGDIWQVVAELRKPPDELGARRQRK
jgi:hypothetical protein